MYPGKALVVPQDDVVTRAVLLDEVVLEKQRLGLGVSDGDLHRRGTRQKGPPLLVPRTAPQPGREAPPEVARLPDVENPLVAVHHPVDTSPARHRLEKGAGVEVGRRVVEHGKRIPATARFQVVGPRRPLSIPSSLPAVSSCPRPGMRTAPAALERGVSGERTLPARPPGPAPVSRESPASPAGAGSQAARLPRPSGHRACGRPGFAAC